MHDTAATRYMTTAEGKRPLTKSETTRLERWRTSTFFVMLFGYVGYYLCRGNLPAAFPLLSQEFGYTNSQLGMIAAYSEIAYAIGKFINGPLADRLGGRKIFLLGMAGAIFWNIVFSTASSLSAFILIWCAARYFLSMGWGGIAKTIGNWYPPEKNGTVMGFISINFQFGGVAAALLAGFLVKMGVNWQGLFLYPAAILFLVLIWSYLASREHPKDVIPGADFGRSEEGKKQIANFGDESNLTVKKILFTLFSMPLFWKLLAFAFMTHLLRSFFIFWTPKYLLDIGMGTATAIFNSAVVPILGCVGTIMLGWYTDNYSKGDRARVLWILLVLLSVCLFGIGLLTDGGRDTHTLIVVLMGASGFLLLGPYSMSSGALTLDIAGPKAAGSCTGMLDGVGYIGGAVAAWGAGHMSDNFGWSEVFYVLAVGGLLSALSAYLMSRQLRRH